MRAAATLGLGTAAVAGLVAWVWTHDGRVAGLVVACLGAFFLARPLVDVASDLRHALRGAALKDLEGRHMEYRGRPLGVLEDADHVRWVRVQDLRAIVGFTASDGALAVSYPSGFRRIGGEPHLSDEALLLHLAREPGPAALKLRHWAEQRITFPARTVRRRLGIRVPPPEAPAD